LRSWHRGLPCARSCRRRPLTERLEDLLQELDSRIQELERLPYPQIRDQVFHVLQLIDRAHRPGLTEIARLLKGAGAWEEVLEHEPSRLLLTLYDLVPFDERAQAELAVEAVRPYIRSHGGEIEILEVENGKVRVRLRGSCDSCAASAATLEHGVLAALKEGFPGFSALVVDDSPGGGPEPASDLVPLRGPVFTDLLALADLQDRVPKLVRSDREGGRSVLVVRVDEGIFAYGPACAACGVSLEGGKVSGTVLVCPFNNCAFDVRTGRRADGAEAPGLGVYPVTAREGRVLLAVDVQPERLFT